MLLYIYIYDVDILFLIYIMYIIGGQRIMDRGEGDDDVGSIEDQFNEWKDKLWPLIARKYLGRRLSAIVTKWEPEIECEYIDNDNELYNIAINMKYPYDDKNFDDLTNMRDKRLFKPMRHKDYHTRIVFGDIVKSYELRKDISDGSTLHIDFDIKNIDKTKKFNYKTADNLGIISRNDYKTVAKLLKRLGLNGDKVIKIKKSIDNESMDSINLPIPKIVTIRNLFLWYLDINGIVGRKLLNCLAQFAQNAIEKTELYGLGKNGLNQNSYDNVVTLLDKYQSVKPPIECLIELLKPLQPRLYTICSSSVVSPDVISICIALEQEYPEQSNDDDTKTNEPIFEGVMTKYLNSSKVKDTFQLYIEPSKFKLPTNTKIPVIMIGVGAGLAPFVAFLNEGNHVLKKQNKTVNDFGGMLYTH